MIGEKIGIVDVGSNTATLGVFRAGPDGFVDRVDQVGASLRLMRAIDGEGRLSADAVKRTVDTFRDFRKLAGAFDAPIRAFATSAVRDAVNGGELVDAVRSATGIDVRIIDGEEEGRAAARCAVDMLPLTDGIVLDVGGGSVQLTRVADRAAREVTSLPLGSLRTFDAFLKSDPPTRDQLAALRRHAMELVRYSGQVRGAPPMVVGIGGTIRSLAKIRRKQLSWPIQHPHGFRLGRDCIGELIEQLAGLASQERAKVPGLAAQRADTTLAGAVVVAAILDVAGADGLLVSSGGIRDGFALRALHGEAPCHDPRRAGLGGRFPDPTGHAALARDLALQPGAKDATSRGIVAWIRAAGGEAKRLLEEPLPGHTQEEVLAAARELGVA